jgi:predicted nucleic acid-binding protein
MVIVDSSVLIDFLADRHNEQTDWLDLHLGLEPIGITSLILSEVLQGIRGDKRFAETLEALSQFVLFETGSAALAIASARNYRRLRELGITIRNTIDTFVATFCIEEDFELLHHDSDFDHFKKHLGLRVVKTPAIAPN